MLVGIVSDTHDNVAAARRAVAAFEDRGTDLLVHCGDYVAPPLVPAFAGHELHGVRGNNDGELDGLEAAFRALGSGSELHGRFAELRVDGASIARLHGEDRDRVADLAAGDYDLVCYGHHHEAETHRVGDTTVVNPGAHFPTVPADHRSVATYDTDTGDVSFVDVGGDVLTT
jgi:putative phosphoesterase